MPTPPTKEKRGLSQIFEEFDNANASFDAKTKRILELVMRFVKDGKLASARAETKADQALKAVSEQHNISLTDLKGQVDNLFVGKRLNEITEGNTSQFQALQTLLDEKIASVRDGANGIDGRTPTSQQLLKLITPLIPEKVFDSITSLKEENERQTKQIEELQKRPVGRGGGTSAMGVAQAFKYIAHTEEPVGLINGSNKVYTVKVDIWWIAGFTLNGENIAELPNYTFANKVITFTSALPSSYSGKDFECKYVG